MSTIAEIRVRTSTSAGRSRPGQTYRSLGSRQVRNRATVGGSICGGGPQRTLIPVCSLMAQSSRVVGVQGGAACRAVGDCWNPGRPPRRDEIPPRFSQDRLGPQRYYRVGPPTNAPCAGPPPRSPLWWTISSHSVASRSAAWRPQPCGRPSPGHRWRRDRLAAKTVDDDGRAFRRGGRATTAVSDLAASAGYRRPSCSDSPAALRHIFGGNRW